MTDACATRPLLVAGIDEAGRGPLAGPVVVAAVVFAQGRTPVNGLDDSKQLSAERREALYPRIVERALAWHVVFIEVDEIDRINIYQATLLGMRRALEGVLPATTGAETLLARIDVTGSGRNYTADVDAALDDIASEFAAHANIYAMLRIAGIDA